MLFAELRSLLVLISYVLTKTNIEVRADCVYSSIEPSWYMFKIIFYVPYRFEYIVDNYENIQITVRTYSGIVSHCDKI